MQATLYLHFASFKPNHTKSLNESKFMAILEIMLISLYCLQGNVLFENKIKNKIENA